MYVSIWIRMHICTFCVAQLPHEVQRPSSRQLPKADSPAKVGLPARRGGCV